ncbi:hypothetical protein Q0T09_24280 [Escherichia coli B12:H4]
MTTTRATLAEQPVPDLQNNGQPSDTQATPELIISQTISESIHLYCSSFNQLLFQC